MYKVFEPTEDGCFKSVDCVTDDNAKACLMDDMNDPFVDNQDQDLFIHKVFRLHQVMYLYDDDRSGIPVFEAYRDLDLCWQTATTDAGPLFPGPCVLCRVKLHGKIEESAVSVRAGGLEILEVVGTTKYEMKMS
jgi:hypothetical protein